ncbi:MAG: VanZ family protein [Tannerella sp.]|jgi:VanZ family protein|nr:VanZ family protein [Tannerella sp.]
MQNNKKTFILLCLSVLWAATIFYLCTNPSNSLPKIGIPHFDKIAHFGVFFIQSVLLSLLFGFMKCKSYLKIIILSTILSFLYGGIIEVLQDNYFNRNGDFYDLLADTVGGFFGAIFFPTVFKLLNRIFRSSK